MITGDRATWNMQGMIGSSEKTQITKYCFEIFEFYLDSRFFLQIIMTRKHCIYSLPDNQKVKQHFRGEVPVK